MPLDAPVKKTIFSFQNIKFAAEFTENTMFICLLKNF